MSDAAPAIPEPPGHEGKLLPVHTRREGDEILDNLQRNLGLLKETIAAAYNVALAVDADLAEIHERELYKRVWGCRSMSQFCEQFLGVRFETVRHRIGRIYRDRELVTRLNHAVKIPTQLDRVREGTGRDPSGRPLAPPEPETREEYLRRLEQQALEATKAPDPRRIEQVQYGRRAFTVGEIPILAPDPGAPSPQEVIEKAEAAAPVVGAVLPAADDPEPPEPPQPAPDPKVAWMASLMAQVSPDRAIDDSTDDQLSTMLDWVEQFIVAGRQRAFCDHHPDARSADGKVCIDCGRQVLR